MKQEFVFVFVFVRTTTTLLSMNSHWRPRLSNTTYLEYLHGDLGSGCVVEDADQVKSDADEDSDLQSQHETCDERRDPRYEVALCQTDVGVSNKSVA